MIKKAFTLVLIALSFQSFSQRVGLKFGMNLSKLNSNVPDFDNSILPGYHLGVTTQISASFISLQSGILFSTTGGVSNIAGLDSSITNTFNYLIIPLNGKFSFGIGSAKIYFFAGTYIGYALSASSASGKLTETIAIGSEINDLKSLDYGSSFGAGFEIGAFDIGLSYQLGLANISNIDPYYINNRVIGLSLGYKIFGK